MKWHNTVEQNCPMCGDRWYIFLNEPEYYRLLDYRQHGGYIQEELSTLNACEREFIKTGYCPECQENIFGNGKTDRVKKVDK